MRQAATIVKGDKYYRLYPNGQIGCEGVTPSGDWLLTGAVEVNNFGNVVRRYSLAEILAAPQSIPWQFKNGKQRVHVTDLDHGTRRQWQSPTHYIY